MAKEPSPQLRAQLDRACHLHDRASSDYAKCLEFNKLMSSIMDQLEDEGHNRLAGKVMSLLLDCNPKEGAQCDKSQSVGERVKKL